MIPPLKGLNPLYLTRSLSSKDRPCTKSLAPGPEISSSKCSCRKGLMVLVALRSHLPPMTTKDPTVRTEAVELVRRGFHGKQRLDGNFDGLGRQCRLFRLEGLQERSHCGAWRAVPGYGACTLKSQKQSFYALALILDIVKYQI